MPPLALALLASLAFGAPSLPAAGAPGLPVCALAGAGAAQEALALRLLAELPRGATPQAHPEWFVLRGETIGLTPSGCQALVERSRPGASPAPARSSRSPERPPRGERLLDSLAGASTLEGGRLFDGSGWLKKGIGEPVDGLPSRRRRSVASSRPARPRPRVPPPGRPALPEPEEECRWLVFCSTPKPETAYSKLPGRLFIRGSRRRAADPGDVKQGGLGDCYLMAALGAIAEASPSRIRRLIRRNGKGSYDVALYRKRRFWELWRPKLVEAPVQVDAAVPMARSKPVFAGPGGKSGGRRELWPMLVEKAYAKLHGSYALIDGGLPERALEELTGNAPRVHDAADVSLEKLAEWRARGKAVVVDTPFSLLELWWPSASVWTSSKYRDRNFVTNHCYWVHRVDPKAGVVTLANPWGRRYKLVVLTQEEFRRRISRVSVVALD